LLINSEDLQFTQKCDSEAPWIDVKYPMIFVHLVVLSFIVSVSMCLLGLLSYRFVLNHSIENFQALVVFAWMLMLMLVNIVLFLAYSKDRIIVSLLVDKQLEMILLTFIPGAYKLLVWLLAAMVSYSFYRLSRKRRFLGFSFISIGAALLVSYLRIAGFTDLIQLFDFLYWAALSYLVFSALSMKIQIVEGRCGIELLRYILIAFIPIRVLILVLDSLFGIQTPVSLIIYHKLIFFSAASVYIFWDLLSRLNSEIGKHPNMIVSEFGLSNREREVYDLLISHLSYKEIQEKLFISLDTVKSHAKSIYRKTGSDNRNGLLKMLDKSPLDPTDG
jgi:DNA-binding CsgD family transcriptional regulator